jgi:hypothetical protein
MSFCTRRALPPLDEQFCKRDLNFRAAAGQTPSSP